MREILFRGKRVTDGEWFYGHLVKVSKEVDVHEYRIYNHTVDKFYSVIGETIGQFTGLNDKNGNKIFEGDIVKSRRIGGTYIGEVVYMENQTRFACHTMQPSSITGNPIGVYENVGGEIIGNIHDNPELVGGAR